MTAIEQQFVNQLVRYCIRQISYNNLQLWLAEHGEEFELDGANPNRIFIDAVEDQMAAYMRGYMSEFELRERIAMLVDEHVDPRERALGR